MLSIYIVSNHVKAIDEWLMALRGTFGEINHKLSSIENACQELQHSDHYDLIIYHARKPEQNDYFFNCFNPDKNPTPIVIANDEGNDSSLLAKYFARGAHDIFHTHDTQRLNIICRREAETVETYRSFLELEQLFTQSQSRYQDLLDSSEEAIAYIQDGMHMHINPAYMAIFSYTDEDELLTRPVMDLIAPNYQNYFKQFLKTASKLTDTQQIEVDCLRADESIFKARLTFKPAVYDTENCLQLGIESLELQKKINLVSDKDPVTGLFSRHHFMQELASRENSRDVEANRFSLMYILIDAFEEMKNQHGLMACDLILKEISGLLQGLTRQDMTLYRFGDHAFTLLLESEDFQKAKYLAENIIRIVNSHDYAMVENVSSPTISIGLAHPFSEDAEQPNPYSNILLNQAYQACRDIYTNGGNGFLAYENFARQMPEDAISVIDDTTHLHELLIYALEHNRLRLVYQPIVSIQGDSVENYAVLVRLLGHDGEEIRPAHFLKEATQFGLMTDIDRWVIKNSIMEVARQRRQGRRMNFFIQLSESAIRDDTLLLWVVDCIRESNAKGNWLTFQLNQPDIIDHLLEADKLVNGLKKINCQIAINHFEESIKSDQLLNRLPVDLLKLRYTLLENIQLDSDERQKLIDLNHFAYKNQIKIVASRVEKSDLMSDLWEIGINYIQGYALHDPAQLENIPA